MIQVGSFVRYNKIICEVGIVIKITNTKLNEFELEWVDALMYSDNRVMCNLSIAFEVISEEEYFRECLAS